MKKFILIFTLLFLFTPTSMANYYTQWIDITPPDSIKYVALDAESVNIHNNSVYYAVKSIYADNARDIGTIYIIQNKDGKIGIVLQAYFTFYLDIMNGYVDKPHPAYVAKKAKEFMEIDKKSPFYKANKKALEILEIKKNNPNSMHLKNGLYKVEKK